MEVSGTIHSIREWEQLIIKKFPHDVIHDGHFKLSEFDSSKSASKIPARSEAYERSYQLFPAGKRQWWEERANVRFFYDERHGTGTMKISSRGMHILGMEIESLQAHVRIKGAAMPLKNNVYIRGNP